MLPYKASVSASLHLSSSLFAQTYPFVTMPLVIAQGLYAELLTSGRKFSDVNMLDRNFVPVYGIVSHMRCITS